MPTSERDAITDSLEQALGKLSTATDEMVVDFASVERITPGALQALGTLSTAAAEKGIRIVLRGVNVSVYKAIKLTKLASPRFSFRD